MGSSKFGLNESLFSEISHDEIPLSFSSIKEAKNLFEYGCHLFTSSHAAQLSCDPAQSPSVVQAQKHHVVNLHSKFSLALQAFVELKGASFSPKENIAIAVLQLHVLNAIVSFDLVLLPPSNRSPWTDFLPQMKEIIALGEKIISSTSSANDSAGQNTSFCLDMGVIIPLSTVINHCRDAVIRRKAITLLRSISRQEGIWNSLLIAKSAERIIEIEESELWHKYAPTDGRNWKEPLLVQPFLELDGIRGQP
jgi:hypothetical protein